MLFDISFALVFAIGLSQSTTAAHSADDAADDPSASPVRLVIDEGSFTIIHDQDAARSAVQNLQPGAIAISCRKLRFDGEHTHVKLACTDASFTTGDGLEGRAAELLYDSSSRSLHLSGANGNAVTLLRKAGAAGLHLISAKEVKIDLQRPHFRLQGAAAIDLPDAPCCCQTSGCPCTAVRSRCHDGDPESPHRIPDPLIAPPEFPTEKSDKSQTTDSSIFSFSVGVIR